MGDLVVNIEIEAFPWKKQDRQILRLQLEPDTSIAEVIDYLIDQGKIKLDRKDIIVTQGNSPPLSTKILICDLDKMHNGTIDLKMKAIIPKNDAEEQMKKQAMRATLPAPKGRNETNSSEPLDMEKSISQPQPVKAPVATSRNTIVDSAFKMQEPKQPPSVVQKSTKADSYRSQICATTSTKNTQGKFRKEEESSCPSRRDDIEFKVDYKEGGYTTQFKFSSKMEDAKSDCMTVVQNSSMVQITILDNNRRIKFEVEKV